MNYDVKGRCKKKTRGIIIIVQYSSYKEQKRRGKYRNSMRVALLRTNDVSILSMFFKDREASLHFQAKSYNFLQL